MIVLLLFGLIHFYLIWFGDILVALRADRDGRLPVPRLRDQDAAPLGVALLLLSDADRSAAPAYEMRSADRAAHAPARDRRATSSDGMPIASFAITDADERRGDAPRPRPGRRRAPRIC